MKRIAAAAAFVLGSASVASAEYVPLITAAQFDGIRTDVGTVAAGIISICLIVVGLGLLVKCLSR